MDVEVLAQGAEVPVMVADIAVVTVEHPQLAVVSHIMLRYDGVSVMSLVCRLEI